MLIVIACAPIGPVMIKMSKFRTRLRPLLIISPAPCSLFPCLHWRCTLLLLLWILPPLNARLFNCDGLDTRVDVKLVRRIAFRDADTVQGGQLYLLSAVHGCWRGAQRGNLPDHKNHAYVSGSRARSSGSFFLDCLLGTLRVFSREGVGVRCVCAC